MGKIIEKKWLFPLQKSAQKTSQRRKQPEDGGRRNLSYLNAIVFFLLGSYNLIKQIAHHESIMNGWGYTVPFFIFSILCFVIQNKYLLYFIYLFIGIITTINAPESSDFSGSIMFVFAFAQIKKPWAAIKLITISALCVTARSIYIDDSIAGNVTMILVYLFVYGVYWFSIYLPSRKKEQPTVNCKELTENENFLLYYMTRGESQKTAGAKIGLNKSQANELMKSIKRKTGYDSVYQITFWLGTQAYKPTDIYK